MGRLKKNVAMGHRPSDSDGFSNRWTFALITRQQTADEQHRFRTAADALLKEIVRQQIGRREN